MITKTKPLGMVHLLVSLSASFMVAVVILIGLAATAHAAVPAATTDVAARAEIAAADRADATAASTLSETRALATDSSTAEQSSHEASPADSNGSDLTNLVALCAAVAGLGFVGAGVTIALAMSRLSI